MTRLKRISRRCVCALGTTLLLAAPAIAAAAPLQVRASSRALAASARALGNGAGLVIKGLVLEGQSARSTLDLKRVDVWRPDAVVEVDGSLVQPPTTAYFRGTVAGEEGSVAMISVRGSGEMQGLVQKGGHSWLVGKGRSQRALRSRKADASEMPPFQCGNDDAFVGEARTGISDPASVALASATVLDQPYVAKIAIETDYEYYAKFNDTTAALDYMGDLIGYSDVTYSREINTDMQIGFARLWTTGASNDPWTASSNTSSALTELRSYWNANMSSVNRTLVQMLSGKGLGGGIAWIGVLCHNYASRGSSYDYGLSASLGTNFNWDGKQADNPANVVWDIIVVQHEIGHNFNSPHTHDYCNIGGSSQPIDTCSAGCLSPAPPNSLPSCTSPTPYFTSGGGAGTLMSYCHQLNGGYGNVAMTFGEGHTCGTLPGREADRMSAHVVARAASYPTCFAAPTCGNGVLDPGEQCDGTNLGGATCASQGFAGGSLACSSTCTFSTSQCTNCGNNVINPGEVCDGSALGGGTCASQGCSGGTLACNSTCLGYNKASCTGCLQCKPTNSSCTSNSQCCSGRCRTSGKKSSTCT